MFGYGEPLNDTIVVLRNLFPMVQSYTQSALSGWYKQLKLTIYLLYIRPHLINNISNP